MDTVSPFVVTPYLLTQVWVLYDNHYYIVKRKLINYVIMRCATKQCPVTLKIMAGMPMPTAPLHHHEPETWLGERNELYQTLRMRAEGESTALALIYDDEALRHPLGAQHMPLEAVLPAMRVWRRRRQPAVPATLGGYATAIMETPHHHLLLGCVTAGGATAVVLGMANFGQCLRQAQYIIADGTFSAVPVAPRAYQLLTIHVIVSARYFHPIIVLMENRTRVLYDAVLQHVWRLAGNPNPDVILTDYETALHASLQAICPTARVLGCFFHFAQALERRARSIGMSTTRHSPGGRMVRLYATLALLPSAQVALALAELQETATAVNADFVPEYHQYFIRYWMQQIGPERFSVGAELHRTSNVAEAFHKSLNGALQRHPNVWQLTVVLEKKLNISNVRYAALQEGDLRGARNFSRHAVRHLECRRLHLELAAGHINVRQCLVSLSRIMSIEDIGEDIGAEIEVGAGPAADDENVEVDVIGRRVAGPVAAAVVHDNDDNVPRPIAYQVAPAVAVADIQLNVAGPVAAAHMALTCQICTTENITSALVPCGHTICENCANNIHQQHRLLDEPHRCPFCRSHVSQLLRLYF